MSVSSPPTNQRPKGKYWIKVQQKTKKRIDQIEKQNKKKGVCLLSTIAGRFDYGSNPDPKKKTKLGPRNYYVRYDGVDKKRLMQQQHKELSPNASYDILPGECLDYYTLDGFDINTNNLIFTNGFKLDNYNCLGGFNLSEEINNAVFPNTLPTLLGDALFEKVIDERIYNAKFNVKINNKENDFWIKLIGQSSLESAFYPHKQYAMCYGPAIAVPLSGSDVIMVLLGSNTIGPLNANGNYTKHVGFGWCNLIADNKENNINGHNMIHILKSNINDVFIAFYAPIANTPNTPRMHNSYNVKAILRNNELKKYNQDEIVLLSINSDRYDEKDDKSDRNNSRSRPRDLYHRNRPRSRSRSRSRDRGSMALLNNNDNRYNNLVFPEITNMVQSNIDHTPQYQYYNGNTPSHINNYNDIMMTPSPTSDQQTDNTSIIPTPSSPPYVQFNDQRSMMTPPPTSDQQTPYHPTDIDIDIYNTSVIPTSELSPQCFQINDQGDMDIMPTIM